MAPFKTLLLNLPEDIERPRDYSSLEPPLGLAVIASYLKTTGQHVVLRDAAAEHLDRNRLASLLACERPDVLGLKAFTTNINQVARFAETARSILPGVKVVVGGPHPSIEPQGTLREFPYIDFGVVGEGERTLEALLCAMEKGGDLADIKGLVWRDQGRIRINERRPFIEDLDLMPPPDWSSLPVKRYFSRWAIRKNYVLMSMSRGCCFNCSFCNHSFIGHKVRFRSPAHGENEIRLLHDHFGVRSIFFTDSTMNIHQEWLREICQRIKALNREIHWSCEYRADRADAETLRLMKMSGCSHIFIGVESADNNMLRTMRKGETIEQIEHGIRLANEAGIRPDLGFIIGMPGETAETVQKTISFAKKYFKSPMGFTLATPYPGTRFYRQAMAEGQGITDWSSLCTYNISYVPAGMSKRTLHQLYSRAIREVLFSPRYLFYQLIQLKSFYEFRMLLRLACRMLLNRLGKIKRLVTDESRHESAAGKGRDATQRESTGHPNAVVSHVATDERRQRGA